MSAAATPEGYAGFGWVFQLWEDAGMSLLAATEPVFSAINMSSTALVSTVAALWLFVVLLRLADGGLVRGLVGGLVIFWVVLYGMRPAAVTLPSGTTIQMLEVQATPLQAAMAIHRIYRNFLDAVLTEHTIAGTIVPAQSAVDDIASRGAQPFEGSDLARLIRDYNASCAPSRAELAGPEHAAKIEALHAVGLLGGGGLGIPDEELGILAQARSAASGLGTFVIGSAEENGGWLNYLFGGGAARTGITRAFDIGAIRSRRAAGLAALENAGPFMGGRYALPSQAHWQSLFAGKGDATPSYLPISSVPGQQPVVVGAGDQSMMFTPSSCVEAYKIAQLGAEQAYRAFREEGGTIAGGQRVSAEVGAVSTATAWQRFVARSLQKTTGLSAEGAEVGAGMLASVQMLKDLGGWLDLQTLLPGYVLLSAWLFWLVLVMAPIFLLMSPLRGAEMLISYASLLLFPVLAMIAAHAVIVAVSLVMASVAIGQAAAASGWAGAGADFDALRGFMGALAAMVLAITTWISSSISRVSLGGLAGSLTGAMATATGVGGFVAKAAGTVMAVSRLGAAGGAAGKAGGRGGRPGGGGPSSVIQPRPASPSPVPSSAASSMSAPQRSRPGPSSVSRANWPSSKPNAGSQDGGRKSPLIPPRQDS
ncbi:hypothetical protein PSCT_04550 [Pseudomonas sp. SCT]|uniref:hypothetical protein n=1 Tax=Pseudomonas sp. (strain SCT) TaxID=412955 RepID=UPI000EDE733D|nr:hypothetical protein [Pseudomonas sp. SCT]GCA58330.1 hypothetical protein PSCT_04550 [Pseudomonas sp. SCT]